MSIRQTIAQWIGGRDLRNHWEPPGMPIPDPDGVPNAYTYNGGGGIHRTSTIPAVYAAVRLLNNTVSRIPKNVVSMDADNYPTENEENPVTALLQNPSRLVDDFQCWEIVLQDYFQHGNGYWLIRRAANGVPIELIPSLCLYARRESDSGEIYYNLQEWGMAFGIYARGNFPTRERVPARDVIAIHNEGFDGLRSPSPVNRMGREAIKQMHLLNDHNSNALASGLNAKTAITMDDSLTQLSSENRDQLIQTIRDSYSGTKNAGKTPVLPPGFDVKVTGGFSALDLQLIDLLKWNVEDIARVFNVPPRMLQHYHEGMRLTGASFEQQSEDLDRWSIQGHCIRIAAQFTRKLIAPLVGMGIGIDETTKVIFNTDMIRTGSLKDKITIATQGVAGGVLTANEARKMLGKKPLPEGDMLITPRGAAPPGDPVEPNPSTPSPNPDKNPLDVD